MLVSLLQINIHLRFLMIVLMIMLLCHNMLDVQNIRDDISHISVLLLSWHSFPVHFKVSICISFPLLSPPPLQPLCCCCFFGVNTDAAGVAAVGNNTLWQLQLDSLPSEHNYAHSFCKFLTRGEGVKKCGEGCCLVFGFVEFGQVLATTRQVNATRCCHCRLPTGGNFDLAFFV